MDSPNSSTGVNSLDAKTLRTIKYHAEQLFSANSWLACTWENCKGAKNLTSRLIQLPGDRKALLSEAGLERLLKLIESLHDSELLEGFAGFSDYAAACQEMVSEALQTSVRLDTGEEIVADITKRIQPRIDHFVFAVPLIGVILKDVEELQLGPYLICRPSAERLTALGVAFEPERIEATLKVHEHYLWLIGEARGTERVAFERFRMAADQLTGFLMMYGGTTYERGGIRFSIRAATAAEELPNRSTWLSWRQSDRQLISTWQMVRSQRLDIDPGTVKLLQEVAVLRYCFALPAKESPSELERAILRAAIWLDDASHERHYAMRLLKLWSCAEIFFSAGENVTRAVCDGVACTLVHGPIPQVDPAGEKDLSRDLTRLYDKRSRATHGGKHAHVTQRDCEQLTEWICWSLANLSTFGLHGTPTVDDVRRLLEAKRSQAV